MSTVLIYDSSRNSGHHLEYILSLLSEIKRRDDSSTKYYFVVSPSMRAALEEERGFAENCEIIYIGEDIYNEWRTKKAFFKANAEIRYIHSICADKGVDRILFLAIDTYQYALGFNRSLLTGVSIEGILFKPYSRYAIDRSDPYRFLRSKLYYFYKWMGIASMMRNPHVRRVWVLNDKTSLRVLEDYFGSERFYYLPDPVAQERMIAENRLLEDYGVNPGNKVLIVFGSISAFKNIENILTALSWLAPSPITLLIMGSWASKEYRNRIAALIKQYSLQYPNLQIVVDDRYFEEDEVDFLISKSDGVLIPYVDFYFSSGVLGRAAALGKPVVGSKGGLCEELIAAYSLGLAVDPHNPAEMADGIRSILSGEVQSKQDGMYRYVDERKNSDFTGVLL